MCPVLAAQEVGRAAALENAIQPQQLLEMGSAFAWRGFSGVS